MQTTTYQVSRHLLERADFRAACAVRDFGEVFRLMRKHDGASQDRICSPVEGLTQSRVSRIMRGDDRIASMDLVERLVDAHRIPGAYVGLARRSWELEGPGASADDLAGFTVPTYARRSSPQVERPVGPRPHVERAFGSDHVTVDFAGFCGETLAGALGEPLDQVRTGRLAPSSIHLRVLVPDPGQEWALPCRVEDLADEPAFRHRAAGILDRSLTAVVDAVAELRDRGAVVDAAVEVRVHPVSPLFKLYLLNDTDAFFGFYPVTDREVRTPAGVRAIYDLMGKDSLLFHHTVDGDPASAGAQYVTEARRWFDSVWGSVAKEYVRA